MLGTTQATLEISLFILAVTLWPKLSERQKYFDSLNKIIEIFWWLKIFESLCTTSNWCVLRFKTIFWMGHFYTNFLTPKVCIFYTNFLTPKILHFVHQFFDTKNFPFLHQNFYIFYTKMVTFFRPQILIVLHQKFDFFYTNFWYLVNDFWCKKGRPYFETHLCIKLKLLLRIVVYDRFMKIR